MVSDPDDDDSDCEELGNAELDLKMVSTKTISVLQLVNKHVEWDILSSYGHSLFENGEAWEPHVDINLKSIA